MRHVLVVFVALVLAATVAAAGDPATVLPKPRFNARAHEPTPGPVRFQILSSAPLDPARIVAVPRPHGLQFGGPDRTTAHLVVAPGRYAFDFHKYAWPPRIAPGEREYVYEAVQWADETNGVLYVETAHSTYARSSYGLNAYLNAVDLKTKRLRWRSPALVANAGTFEIVGHIVVTGYGFTDEPDYLYAIDRRNGHVAARVLLPTAPEGISRNGNVLTVDTYDHRVTVRITGA